MDSNPYRILGVSENATDDEVKKAYRKKARENHPDLNPDDPAAAKRMKEINEAYDKIVNPDKYARRAAPSSSQNPYGQYRGTGYGSSQGSGYGSGYGGYGNPYGNTGRGGSQSGGPQSDGPYGWAGGFDFDDLFGGVWGEERTTRINPEVGASDSAEVRQAINLINSGHYTQAVSILSAIPSTGRNARWYYLSALAHNGAGNSLSALENIRKAVRMDPDNTDYTRAQRFIQQTGQVYREESQARGFSMTTVSPGFICCGLITAQYFCRMFTLGTPC